MGAIFVSTHRRFSHTVEDVEARSWSFWMLVSSKSDGIEDQIRRANGMARSRDDGA